MCSKEQRYVIEKVLTGCILKTPHFGDEDQKKDHISDQLRYEQDLYLLFNEKMAVCLSGLPAPAPRI